MDNIQLCSLDGNQLKDKKSLYRHNKLHFREGEHICSICKKVFTQKAYLLKHVKQLHSAPSYVCNNCNDTFPNSHNLKRHVESVHQNNSYCCQICGNSYSRKDCLKTHYAKCKKQDEPPQTQNSHVSMFYAYYYKPFMLIVFVRLWKHWMVHIICVSCVYDYENI